MTRTVKLALLGCGDVAQRDYLPEMHRLAGRAELVAVCGRTPERVRQVADQYDIPARYDDYRTMLAESDAEAVINLTPIQTHTETTLAALAAGKHVYSEKPVATTLDDARRIRDEADRRGLTLVCAPSVLLFPQVRFARELVASGRIGTVHAALGRGYGGVPPWSGYPSDPSPFFARGAGPLADMGVYPLHAITGILGPVETGQRLRRPGAGQLHHRGRPVRRQARPDRGRGQLASHARLRRRTAGLGDRQQRRPG